MLDGLNYRSFSLLDMEMGLISNFPSILYDDEYFTNKHEELHSLLTNFYQLREIPFTDEHDLYVHLHSTQKLPLTMKITDKHLYVTGNIKELEETARDKRKTLFGNMGLLSKLCIRGLEKRGIFSLHSTAMFSPKEKILYLVLGESGSGKSTVLLAGLSQGLQLFSSELTHFQWIGEDLYFYKGPIYQNCRVGNLVEDFPDLIEEFQIENLPQENIWHAYRSIYMGDVQTLEDVFKNPQVELIFPRIEANRNPPIKEKIGGHAMIETVFSSLCQKISPPTLLYGDYFVPSIDENRLQKRRYDAACELMQNKNIKGIWNVLASPNSCLNGIVQGNSYVLRS